MFPASYRNDFVRDTISRFLSVKRRAVIPVDFKRCLRSKYRPASDAPLPPTRDSLESLVRRSLCVTGGSRLLLLSASHHTQDTSSLRSLSTELEFRLFGTDNVGLFVQTRLGWSVSNALEPPKRRSPRGKLRRGKRCTAATCPVQTGKVGSHCHLAATRRIGRKFSKNHFSLLLLSFFFNKSVIFLRERTKLYSLLTRKIKLCLKN